MDVSLLIRLIDQVSEPAKKVGDALNGIGDQAGELAAEFKAGFGQAIREGFSVENVEHATKNAEAALGRARGRLMGALGQALALGAPVKLSADFQTAMNRVQALSKATAEELEALRNQALELGRTTQFTTNQAADAMGFLAMAGFRANDILAAMPGTLQLAASAQLDLARSADIVTNILTGYNMEVEQLGHVNDVLVMAFTSANTDLSQLAEAMKYAGPVASGAGVGFEEAAAALAMMGNAGIQASMAGTSLRGAISRSLNPSKQMREIMKEAGLSFTDSQGRLVSLVEIIRQLEPHAEDAGLFMALFGQRAGPAMMALVSQGADAVAELTEELQNAAGTAERVANIQMSGFNGALLEARSAIEGVAIALGTTLLPALTDLLQSVTPVINGFTDFAAANPALVAGMTKALAVVMALSIGSRLLGFVLAALRLQLIHAVTFFLKFNEAGRNVATGWRILAGAGRLLAGTFGLVKAAALAIAAVIAGISAPVWAAVAAIAAAGLAIWKYWDRISSFAAGFASVFTQLIGAAVAGAIGWIDSFVAKLAELLGFDGEALSAFKAAMASAFDFSGLVDGAKTILSDFWSWLGGVFSAERLSDDERAGMHEAGRALAQSLIDGLMQYLSDGWAAVEGWVSDKVAWLREKFTFEWPSWLSGGRDAATVGAERRSGMIRDIAATRNEDGDAISGFLAGMDLSGEARDAGNQLGSTAADAIAADAARAGSILGRAAAAEIAKAAVKVNVAGSGLAGSLDRAASGALHDGVD